MVKPIRLTEDDRCTCCGTPVEHLAYCEVELAFVHDDCGHLECRGLR